MAGCGLAGRFQHHQTLVGAVERPRGVRGAALLLLSAGGGRDAHLDDRGTRCRARGHRAAKRRRCLHASVLQDGHRLRQDDRHGDGDCLARLEQGGLPAGRTLRQERAGHGPGADREKPTGCARAGGGGELLRGIQHRAVAAARQSAAGQGAGAQLARPGLGQ